MKKIIDEHFCVEVTKELLPFINKYRETHNSTWKNPIELGEWGYIIMDKKGNLTGNGSDIGREILSPTSFLEKIYGFEKGKWYYIETLYDWYIQYDGIQWDGKDDFKIVASQHIDLDYPKEIKPNGIFNLSLLRTIKEIEMKTNTDQLPEKWCIKTSVTLTGTQKTRIKEFAEHQTGRTYILDNIPYYYHFPDFDHGCCSSWAIKPGYTEISYEEFEKYVLTTKENPIKSNVMEKQTITKEALKEIYDIACPTWKDKINQMACRDPFSQTIDLTAEEVHQMLRAATDTQLLVLKKYLKEPSPQIKFDFETNKITIPGDETRNRLFGEDGKSLFTNSTHNPDLILINSNHVKVEIVHKNGCDYIKLNHIKK